MAAVVRVKRRVEDESFNTLILNCKKRKTNEETKNNDPEVSTVLKFAGTLENQEDDFLKHVKRPSKRELEEQFKKHNVDLSSKLRAQKDLNSKNNRYKVINCFRSSNNNDSSEKSEEMTVYDIENEIHEADSEAKYVYDLYYTMCDDLGDAYLEEHVNVYPYIHEPIFMAADDCDDNESEDSNAENNWRNDYPDESDVESITEEDMVQAMKRVDLDDLSSDEDDHLYGENSENCNDGEIDESDVQRYGERYAKFKAKHQKNMLTSGIDGDLYCGDIDENEYYY